MATEYFLHYVVDEGVPQKPIGVRDAASLDAGRTGTAVWPGDVICCADVVLRGSEEWAVLEDGCGYVNVRTDSQ